MHPSKSTAAIVIVFMVAGVAAVQYGTLRFEDENKSKLVKSENETLSEYIWNHATDLLLETWNTTFIAGVAAGDLDPNFYGEYSLQDAAWCREVAKLWRQLSGNESEPEVLRAYANHSYYSYQNDSVEGFEAWYIKDDGEDNYGVIPQDAATNYVNVIREAMLQYPPNAMIATYACAKLWSNVTADLWSFMSSSEDNCSNPYQIWVEDNMGDSYTLEQAAAMDEWDQEYHWYNWTEALLLFRTVMQCEINLFNMKTGVDIARQRKTRLNQSMRRSQ